MKPLAVALVVALVLLLVAAAAPNRQKRRAGRYAAASRALGSRAGAPGGTSPCYSWTPWTPGTGPVPAWAVNQTTDAGGVTQVAASAHTGADQHGTTYGYVEVGPDPTDWQFVYLNKHWKTSTTKPASVGLIRPADPSCPTKLNGQPKAPGAWGFTGSVWGPCASSQKPGLTWAGAACPPGDEWCQTKTKYCPRWSGYADGYNFVKPEFY